MRKRNYRIVPMTILGLAFLLPAGCINSQPPAAVTKTSFTEIEPNEQKTIPAEVKFLSMSEAQNIAIQNNPDFKKAYFAISQARAAYYGKFAPYLPSLTFNYSIHQTVLKPHNRTANSSTGGGNNYATTSIPSLSGTWLIFDSFQREMNLLAAKHAWKQSEELELNTRRLLLLSVSLAYNNIMLYNAKIKIAKADMKYNRELLKETELKFGVGATTLSDVLNFKVQYNKAENDLYNAQDSYATAKFALAKLMGLTEGIIPDNVKFPEMPSPDGEMLADINLYLDMALANRPDLKALREALEAQKYTYYSSIAAFGPTATFDLSLAYTDKNAHIAGRYGESSYSSHSMLSEFTYGGTVSWEFFSGGATFFNMRAQQAVLAQANWEMANTWYAVIAEVRVAYENYLTSLKQVKLNQKNLEIVRKQRDLVNEEYIAGSTNITRLNEAQRDLVDAETALVESTISLHNAKAELLSSTNSL